MELNGKKMKAELILMFAYYYGYKKGCKTFNEGGTYLDKQDKYGNTILIKYCYSGKENMIKFLQGQYIASKIHISVL